MMTARKLYVLGAAPMNYFLHCKLFFIHPLHFRSVFSTESHSQTLFSQFASTKLNLSEADITRMFKWHPHLQNIRTLDNAEKIIYLFKERGFTEVEIARLVKTAPQIIANADGTLEPKLKLLEDFGFVDRNLVKVLMTNPATLSISLKNSLLPKLEFLKDVFQSQDELIKALRRGPRLLSYNLDKTLKPSLAFWEGWGFTGLELVSFLQINPIVLARTSLTPAQVDLILKIDADQKSKAFKYLLSLVAISRTKTLEAKIEKFKVCGLSAEETWQLFGTNPTLFYLSEETICEKMNFVVANMEQPANYVVKHPSLLQISLEKTMRPRFLVWQKIKSINALEPPLLTVLTMSKTRFVNRIIKEHPESEMLWAIYENAISNASKRTTKHPNLWGKREPGLKNHNKSIDLVFDRRQADPLHPDVL